MIKGIIFLIPIIALAIFFAMRFEVFDDFINIQDSTEEFNSESAITLAEEAIEINYQYVQYNGYNLRRTESGRGIDGIYLFSYIFDVNTDLLPDDIISMSLFIEVDESGARIASIEEIRR